jgi:hypothetical protein
MSAQANDEGHAARAVVVYRTTSAPPDMVASAFVASVRKNQESDFLPGIFHFSLLQTVDAFELSGNPQSGLLLPMTDFQVKLEMLWHSARTAETAGNLAEAEEILAEAITLCVAHGDIECVIAAYEHLALMLERQNRLQDAEAARKMTIALQKGNHSKSTD